MPGGVRAVFFDAVGTLIHPDPPAADAYLLVGRSLGSRLDVGEVRRRFVNAFRTQEQFDLARDLRTSEEREWERWRLIVAAVLDDVRDPDACFQRLHSHFAQPGAWRCEAGAAEVIEALHRAGCLVGLASNFDQRLHGLVRGLPALAGADCTVISSEVGWKKPSPHFFARLTELTGLPPGEILVVGDDVDNDVAGARVAGMQALLFDPDDRHGFPPADRIRELGALLG
jgi:putative hydrolase of the HAD superfamily